MRQQIVAGNWKMNCDFNEGMQLIEDVKRGVNSSNGVSVILATPSIHLKDAVEKTKEISNIYIAAQNCHQAKSGAYTGELSVDMLRSIGVTHVVIGHSERRQYFRETNEQLAEKVKAILEAGMTPIYCCGEPLSIRGEGWHNRYVKNQLERGLFALTAEEIQKVVVAYEPIWAIGTGETATPEQAQDMHNNIRTAIANQYTEAVANEISILYGGSVKPKNAAELFAQADVDGGLVGGASLKAETFLPITEAFKIA